MMSIAISYSASNFRHQPFPNCMRKTKSSMIDYKTNKKSVSPLLFECRDFNHETREYQFL